MEAAWKKVPVHIRQGLSERVLLSATPFAHVQGGFAFWSSLWLHLLAFFHVILSLAHPSHTVTNAKYTVVAVEVVVSLPLVVGGREIKWMDGKF